MTRTGLTWSGAAGRVASNLAMSLLILAAGAAFVWHLVDGETTGPREPTIAARARPPREAIPREALVVILDAAGQTRGGIAVLEPNVVTHRDEAKAYGTVLGVEKLTALDNGYRAAVSQLQTARARAVASKAAVERAKKLLTIFSTAVAQVETAEATYESDQAGVSAAEAQVRALARSAVQDWGPVLGRALIDDGPLVARLMEGRASLVQVTLPAEIAQETAATPPATIALRSRPGAAPIQADYISRATTVDPRMQGASFLYSAEGTDVPPPGMNVLATVPVGAAVDAIEVPASSVVWQGGRAWIFVRAGVNAFKRHPLPEGLAASATGGYFVPVSSLPADVPAIVVAGAQALLSEESRAEIPKDDDDK